MGAEPQPAPVQVEAAAQADCHRIADKVGRAGMVASQITYKESSDTLILAIGGANFPQAKPGAKTPAERGPKVFYDEVQLLWYAHVRRVGAPSYNLFSSAIVGKLPYPIGYAAHTTVGFTSRAGNNFLPGVIVAGGCNMEGHTDKVTHVVWNYGRFSTTALPALPVTLAYPAFVEYRGRLYVFGGQEKAESTTCLNTSYMLEVNAPEKGWKALAPMPGDGRMLAAAGVWKDGKIYVAGGCSLHADAKGAAERTYLKSTLCYDPATDSWSRVADMPETIVAPATPMPTLEGGMLLICGDPGNYYRASLEGKAPAEHPGQNTTIYAYNPDTNTWSIAGQNCIGIATAPAVQTGGRVRVISGETHPGVRTPIISNINTK